VARRDGYQCTFVDPQTGRRCPARSNLQYHHAQPWGKGGTSEPSNLALVCRAHNLLLAEQDYGAAHVERRVEQARQAARAGGGGAGQSHGDCGAGAQAATGVIGSPRGGAGEAGGAGVASGPTWARLPPAAVAPALPVRRSRAAGGATTTSAVEGGHCP